MILFLLTLHLCMCTNTHGHGQAPPKAEHLLSVDDETRRGTRQRRQASVKPRLCCVYSDANNRDWSTHLFLNTCRVLASVLIPWNTECPVLFLSPEFV